MNLTDPATVLLAPGDAKALTVLAGTTRPLSGREIAKLGGGNPATTWRSLTRLAEHGLLVVQEAGAGTLLYTLNRDHLAASAVQTLVDLRGRLVDRLRAEIARWEVPPRHSSMFGSAARGDGDTNSDIDLFVVRTNELEDKEKWEEQLDSLATAVLSWTGNQAGIADVTEAQAWDMLNDRRPIVSELSQDAIWLSGMPIQELLADLVQ